MQKNINISRILKILILSVTILLLTLPFFWFKNGLVDLGGDSSRLYFIAPLLYLKNFAGSAILSIGQTHDVSGYYAIPFALILNIISFTVNPSGLDSLFSGLNLSLGFLFVFLSAKFVIKNNIDKQNINYVNIASVFAALIYIFVPFQMASWEKPLSTQYSFFLNPLFFFLFAKFLRTSKSIYIYIFLVVSVVFSQNYSFAGTPFLFSFYPLTILYLLFIESQNIRKKTFLSLFIAILVAIILHAFHWFPVIANIMDKSSNLNTQIFDKANIQERGLNYFISNATNTLVYYSLIGAIQFVPLNIFSYLYFVYPTIIFIGGYFVSFLKNKSAYIKKYLSTVFIFNLLLLFVSGHILNVMQVMYSWLFYLPGFSMFRAFNDKWGSTFFFYYSILLAFSLYIILISLKKKFSILIILLLMIPLINGFKFIKGDTVFPFLYYSKDYKVGIKLENDFMESIRYVDSIKSSYKWLNLPLADWEYQAVKDNEIGVYIGPSVISLIGGKTDYLSLVQFENYKDYLSQYLTSQDYSRIKLLLSTLSVKYAYLNSDQKLFESYSGQFPYSEISKIIKIDGDSYKALLSAIGYTRLKEFGHKYEIYETKESVYPLIFSPDCVIEANYKGVLFPFDVPNCKSSKYPVILNKSIDTKNEQLSIQIYEPYDIYQNKSSNSIDTNLVYSFAKYRPNTILYSVSRLKEDLSLSWMNKTTELEKVRHVNFLYASKRIYELDRYRSNIPAFGEGKCAVNLIFGSKNCLGWTNLLDSYSSSLKQNILLLSAVKDQKVKLQQINEISSYIDRDSQRIKDFIDASTFTGSLKSDLNSYSNQIFTHLNKELNGQTEFEENLLSYQGVNIDAVKGFTSKFYIESVDPYNLGDVWMPISLNSCINSICKIKLESQPDLIRRSQAIIPFINFSNNSSYSVSSPPNLESSWLIKEGIRSNTYYKLIIRHKLGPEYISLFVNQYNPLMPELSRRQIILQKNINNQIGDKSSYIFKTPLNISNLEIIIRPSDLAKNNVYNILEVELVPMALPRIMQVKTPDKDEIIDTPQINFQKINDSKYLVKINNIHHKFFLAFNNRFSHAWRIYMRNAPSSENKRNFISKFAGIFKLFDDQPFEVFSNQKINSEHLLINYFANGWLIKPEDIQNNDSVTLVLEHSSQGIFYQMAVLSCLLFIIISLIIFIKLVVDLIRFIFLKR